MGAKVDKADAFMALIGAESLMCFITHFGVVAAQVDKTNNPTSKDKETTNE